MNKKVLKTLEFDKIIEQLCGCCTTASGLELCKKVKPSYDLGLIKEMQQQTSDALSRILRFGTLDLSGSYDLFESCKRLEIGGTLNAIELMHVCSTLDVAKRAKNYDRNERDGEITDSLRGYFEELSPLTNVSQEIRRCILSENEIADDASSTLRSIRKSIRSANEKIKSQLNSIINQQSSKNMLQDNVITMRNGRYCLPVRSDSKSQFPGMVHDQSSSGSTFFIEPMGVVKLNNELTELELKEQEEIQVILSNLSNMVGEHVSELRTNCKVLTRLDVIFAKGELAHQQNGTAPVFNTEGRIHIKKGRHPLLKRDQAVPIDIRLGDDFDLLIVTGPNTGGKTVSLKTVGLLTLMGQAGLHIPASDGSQLGLFEEVYADIGDEQSIEQNLSTFSSHMTNIVSIGEKADEHSLVLFDELCAGTDPTEGAALAISVLWDLMHRGAKIMATTHYAELKVFALTTPRVENACCEFNVETLSPTYRLLIGIPGKSNAFAISSKLGLPNYIIEDAKKRLDSESESFEDILSNLETKRTELENSYAKAKRYEEEVKALKEQLALKQEDLTQKRENLIRSASQEAQQILREAKEVADKTIRDFQKYAQEAPTLKEMEEQRAALRSQLEKTQKKGGLKPTQPAPVHDKPLKLHVGDSVRVHSLNLNGVVHTLPDAKGNLFVQMGILRSSVNIRDLSLIEESSSTGKKGSMKGNGIRTAGISKAATVSPEINLIGKKVDEAIAELDKYLDNAYLAHLDSVRIVHGKGTGALRNAVIDYLKRQSYVKSFRAGVFGEGDAGVTIAEFK